MRKGRQIMAGALLLLASAVSRGASTPSQPVVGDLREMLAQRCEVCKGVSDNEGGFAMGSHGCTSPVGACGV